jgi:hypothetical protein
LEAKVSAFLTASPHFALNLYINSGWKGRLPPLKPALLFGVIVIVWRRGDPALEQLSNKLSRSDQQLDK